MRKSKIAGWLMTALLLSVLALTELAQLRGETGGKTALFLPTENVIWLDYETGEPFDPTAPITRDRVVVEEAALGTPDDESPME